MRPSATEAKNSGTVSRVIWRGRDGMRIENERICLTMLTQGGTLAEFGFADGHGYVARNVLWEAPWLDESLPQTDAAIERAYGDLGAGRFLNRYTGHALCLDGFGPATAEEIQAGAALHGEATLAEWQLEGSSTTNVTARAHLPLAQLDVERRLSVQPGETVVRIEEQVTNIGQNIRALHWVQHVTIGQPFFDETSVISTSVSKGITWPFVYEGVGLLAANAQFAWPDAPKADGGTLNLSRLFAAPGAGFVATARQQEKRYFGFVATLHPEMRIALLYLFPANLFSWVAFWEENRCRKEWPWNGRTQARGLEFGTTPLPLGNAQVDAAGPLFDTPTSLALGAGASICAPWILAIAKTPQGWDAIREITVERDALRIYGKNEFVSIPALGIEAFLCNREKSA
jgi:hypothetical protein